MGIGTLLVRQCSDGTYLFKCQRPIARFRDIGFVSLPPLHAAPDKEHVTVVVIVYLADLIEHEPDGMRVVVSCARTFTQRPLELLQQLRRHPAAWQRVLSDEPLEAVECRIVIADALLGLPLVLNPVLSEAEEVYVYLTADCDKLKDGVRVQVIVPELQVFQPLPVETENLHCVV